MARSPTELDPITMSLPSSRLPTRTMVPLALAGICLAVAGCAVVMDLDFSKYRVAEPGLDASAGAGGSAGSDTGGSAGSAGSETGGSAGTGGTGPADASAEEAAGPSCDDGILNQGEEKPDCGGPCPACPGFTHTENFDAFPTPGPDGPYAVGGVCADDPYVDGWVLSNQYSSSFPQGTGYYAVIDTNKLLYSGLVCDDTLATPELLANSSSKLSISFDTTFAMISGSHVEVILVRDGAPDVVWSKYSDFTAQRVTISDLPIADIQKVRVLFRYVGEYDLHWMVDNIAIVGE